ncbi:MAG: hypothetical protein HY050_09420 [Actinobacteria bacterium]|nr:hypothetical protein [Actinomycetota bacterium]
MNKRVFSRYKVLLEAWVIVSGVIGLKLIADFLNLEFINMTPLFTSIIAGSVFVISIILAGTMADYKESEKMPAEIVASLDSIYDEGLYIKELKKEFNQDLLRQRINDFIETFRTGLLSGDLAESIGQLKELNGSFLEMETLGVPANYIVRLKTELGLVKKNLLRIQHIQTTRFLPSAYILLETIMLLIISLLLVTKIEPRIDGVVMTAFISYLLIYIIKLLRVIDSPFRKDSPTMDDVSMFLVREFEERMNRKE